MTMNHLSAADLRKAVLPQTAGASNGHGDGMGARALAFLNDDETFTVEPAYIRPLDDTSAVPFQGDALLTKAFELRLSNIPPDRLAQAVNDAWGATLHGPVLAGISRLERNRAGEVYEVVEMISMPATIPINIVANWVERGLAQPETLVHAAQQAAA